MTVQFLLETKPEFSFHYKALAKKVIEASLDAEQFPYEAEVCVSLVDAKQMQELNRLNRGIDATTDVLSFPMLSYPAAGDFSELDDQVAFCVNPDTDEVILGDIVLSVEKVKEQAAAFGHSQKREYAFLITHSMLHLMGYDHMSEEEAACMQERQRAILNTLEIFR